MHFTKWEDMLKYKCRSFHSQSMSDLKGEQEASRLRPPLGTSPAHVSIVVYLVTSILRSARGRYREGFEGTKDCIRVDASYQLGICAVCLGPLQDDHLHLVLEETSG